MRIDEMPAVMHDWPEHTKLTEGEADTVRVVAYDELPGPARTPAPVSLQETGSRGPARLITRPSADDHHDVAIRAMVEQVRLAYDALSLPKTGAQAWAYAINYHSDVRDELYEAVARIQHALDLIDIHENG